MNKLIAAAAIAAVACGCVTVHKNDGGNSDLRPNVVKDVVHEKFAVGEQTVTASDTVSCLFGFITWGSTATHVLDQSEPAGFGVVGKAKKGAYANALDAAKCDQIVGTRYKVTVDDYFVFSKATAEITGYPATLTGVEVIENKCPMTAEKTGKCGPLAL